MRNSRHSMICYKDYVAGWLDRSIRDFLEHFPSTSKSMDFALITALDSNLIPSSLLSLNPELKSIRQEAKPLQGGILLPTALLRKADASHRIFFGFDEVWFFPNDRIKPKP